MTIFLKTRKLRQLLKFKYFNVLVVSLIASFILTLGILGSSGTDAASYDYINFQGKLTDQNGFGIVSQTKSITFCIFSASTGGSCSATPSGQLWYETKNVTTDARGIFNTALGDTTAFGTLFTNNSNNDLYLAVNVASDGEMTPRHAIGSVPKSFNSSRLEGSTWAAPGAIGTTTANSGSFTSLSASSMTISGLLVNGVVLSSSGNLISTALLNSSYGGTTWNSSSATGMVKVTSGTWSTATAGTDYVAGGVGTNHQVAFFTGAGVLSGSNNLYWDNSNVYLGVGGTPTAALHVQSSTTASYARIQGADDGDNYAALELWNSAATQKWQFALKSISGQTGDFNFVHYDGTSWSNPFTITNTGNVGIGTTSPAGRLHSYISNAAVTTSQYAGYFENLATNTTTDGINKYGLYINSTGSFTGSTGTATNNYGLYVAAPTGADNNYAAIFAGGNVGIGTSSPTRSLHLAQTTANTSSVSSPFLLNTISTGDMVDGFGGGIIFGINDNTLSTENIIATIYGIRDGADNSGALTASTYSSGTRYERLRITSAGNVGIGTTSPWAPLSVNGAIRTGTDSTNYGGMSWSSGLQVNTYNYASPITFNGGSLYLSSGSTGNVGIGTTTPGTKLEVYGTGKQANGVGIEGGELNIVDNTAMAAGVGGYVGFGGQYTSGGSYFSFARIGGIKESGTSADSNGALVFETQVAGAGKQEKMRITSSGNLGIGTTSPTGRLHSYISNSAVTTSQYTGYLENLATNTTTDGINKYGLYITSTGTFTGSTGTATNNYGLYIASPTGADNNYSIYSAGGSNNFVGSIITYDTLYVADTTGEAVANIYNNTSDWEILAGTGTDKLVMREYGGNDILTITPSSVIVGEAATSLIPAQNNTAGYTVGTSSYRWKQGYFVDGIVTGSSSTTYAESGVSSTYAGALGITPTSGQNFNISLATTGDLTVNTDDLVVDTSAGNVGINTTGPDRRLDVLDTTNPQLRLTYTDNSVYTDFQTSSVGDLTITPTGDDTFFAGGGWAEVANATVTGAGGLRTGSSYGLTMQNYQNCGGDAFMFQNAYSIRGDCSGNAQTFNYISTHASFGERGIGFSYGSAAGKGITFYADTAATTADATFTPTARMVIQNNGAVGIGTTSPDALLDVVDGSIYQQGVGGISGYLADGGALSYSLNKASSNAYLSLYNSSSALTAHIGSGDDSYFTGGNVGIGTTTPNGNLTIFGSTAIGSGGTDGIGNILMQNNAVRSLGVGPSITFAPSINTGSVTNTYTQAEIIGAADNSTNANAAGQLRFRVKDYISSAWSWRDAMTIRASGSVGIGTAVPATNTTLDVNGMIRSSRLGFAGTYNSAEVQGIWSIGPAYLIDTTNDDFGTLYGMGYAYNQNGGSPFAGQHQIVFTNNGTINAAISLAGQAWFASTISASNLSGSNTGDQTITLTGDVTGSGTGSFATTIAANAVDGTMIALGSDATGDIMYYNGTNYVRLAGAAGFLKSTGAAAPAWSAVTKTDVGLSNVPNLSFSGSNTGDQTITLTGPVTGSGTGSFATTIAANATTAGAFYVGATLYINGSLAGESGDPSLCRDPTTGRVGSCSSSLRYKKDITNISDENVEVILEGLDSRLYTLKDGGGQRFGMIAEEANAVNSLLTYNNDQGQVEGIYYDSVTSLLVQGHQIQSRLIGNLSTQLNNSNAAISDLTTSVTNNNSALSSLGLETTTISDNLYNLNTEVFDSDQSLVEGDVVSLVSDSVKKITKSNGDDIETVGVVKKVLDNNQYRVTYGGATSIEVSVTKGQILAGDKLTTSKDYPGKAVRANENTKNIIGIALEPATEDMTIEIILRNDYSPQSASVGTLTSEQSQTLSLFSVGIDGHLIVKGDLEIQGNLKLSGNNRGMNVSIPANSTHVDITFDKARDNNNYSVTVTPSWFTNFAVTQKSASGFRIEFNTTAPANATIDWLVID